MSSAHLILNPMSAGGKGVQVMKQIQPRLAEIFPGLQVHQTQKAYHAAEIAAAICADPQPTLISMGGDGTNHEILNGIFHQKKSRNPNLVLGFIPTGSGNDFVRSLGIPGDPYRALECLRSDQLQTVDIGVAKFTQQGLPCERYFLNSVSMGVSGLANKILKSKGKRWGGKLSYLLGGLQALIQFRPLGLAVNGRGGELESGTVLNLVCANGRYFGGGMLVSPLSSLQDKQLDLVWIGSANKVKSIFNFGRIYNGSHLSLPFVRVHKGRAFEIVALRENPVLEIDGEVIDASLPVQIDILESALKLRGVRL